MEKFFFNVVDRTKLPRVLELIAKNRQPVQVCESDYDKDEVESFLIVDVVPNQLKLILKKESDHESIYKNKEIFFRTTLGQYKFFASTCLSYNESDGIYSVEMLHDFFSCQLRRDRRLVADESRKIEYSIAGHIYSCRDISSGGVSIIVPENMQDGFTKNMDVGVCQLRLNSVTYEIMESKVVTIFDEKDEKSESTKNMLVGISFINFPVESEDKFFKHMHKEICAEDVRKAKDKKLV